MSDNKTVKKDASQFGKSLGSGAASIFGGKGRTFYLLEYKSNTASYKIGQTQQIIVDYIELGRDPKCQVQFGDEYPTVSRRHAAIVKEGNNCVLKHLSQSNPTLVNGKPVTDQWFLKNGDEIQLSLEGPRLSFFVPGNAQTNSIGLTRRLNLFRQQALRPYKTAMVVISVVFILAIAGLGYLLLNEQKKAEKLQFLVEEIKEKQQIDRKIADSLMAENAKNRDIQKKLESKILGLQTELQENKRTFEEQLANLPQPSQASVASTEVLRTFTSDVYFVSVDKITLELEGQVQEITDFGWSGTGFLLNDGRFVTARHVIDGWYFQPAQDETMLYLNIIDNNGGDVTAYFTAYSPSGATLQFNSTQFNTNRSGDMAETITDVDGNTFVVQSASLEDGNDWSVMRSNKTGTLSFDPELSANLKMGSTLYVLGYPFGLDFTSIDNLKPMYSEVTVGQDGLFKNKIQITDLNFDHGNSGGPVFVEKEGTFTVVGIISASAYSIGWIIPIGNTR